MEEGRVRNVERILQRGVQGALEVTPKDHLTGTGALDRGQGERMPNRFGIRFSPGPHDAVLLDRRVRRDAPGVGRLRAAVGKPGDSHALPAAVVGPAVVTALERALVGYPAERERVVAMRAAVEEDGRRASGVTEQSEGCVHERHGQRSSAQVRRSGDGVPPTAREGHRGRPGLHGSMMPVRPQNECASGYIVAVRQVP
jgi:hypothetical protein